MHPLTVTWAPHIYTEWGWRNHQAWIHAGFDNLLFTPNGRTHRLLTRLAVENLFHPFQPFILGQKNLAPKIAVQMGIPLVFYGENEAEYGNPLSDTQSALRDQKYFVEADPAKVFLAGTSVAELQRALPSCRRWTWAPTCRPTPRPRKPLKLEVHYLGYYLRWHPQSCYYYAVENGGFEAAPERTPGTYSKYNSIDDRIDDFHYYTTYIKFGIGRATYDAAQEVRSGDITRDEAVALVQALRRRVARALRRRDLPLPVPPGERVRGGVGGELARPDPRSGRLRRHRRPLPLAPPVAQRARRAGACAAPSGWIPSPHAPGRAHHRAAGLGHPADDLPAAGRRPGVRPGAAGGGDAPVRPLRRADRA